MNLPVICYVISTFENKIIFLQNLFYIIYSSYLSSQACHKKIVLLSLLYSQFVL